MDPDNLDIGNETAIPGNAMQIGLSGLTFVCVVSLTLHNKWENAKRQKGLRDHRLTDGNVAAEQLGSHHPEFRYSL